MKPHLSDASPEAARVLIRAPYREHLSERETRLRLAALRLDREVMVRVFGWDPDVEGYRADVPSTTVPYTIQPQPREEPP